MSDEKRVLKTEELDKVSGGEHPPMEDMVQLTYVVPGDMYLHQLYMILEWNYYDLCKWNPHLQSCTHIVYTSLGNIDLDESYVRGGTEIVYYL